ncbi:MAG: PD-(D/E)XK nuclease family protein [Bacteroidota bacterium]
MNTLSEERNLLTQVGQVVSNYEKSLRVTGNGFSFIQALRLESDEVRFHTRLIGYLLDPKAGHFQGGKFLKFFFEAVGIKEDPQGFTVEIEKHVGKRDWGTVEGGRIDLLISNSSEKPAFAIEVKIYAGEQEKQLQRYHKYLNRFYPNQSSKVYFLTLYGDQSREHKAFDKYQSISFGDDILKWIESCRLASIDQPIIRETLTQYIANIKRLTNQNQNDEMSNEIIKLITSSSQSIKAFETLLNSQHSLYQEFGEQLISSIKKIPGFEDRFRIEFPKRKIPNPGSEIYFWLKGSSIERITLYWQSGNTVLIGMYKDLSPDKQIVDKEIREKFNNKISNHLKLGKYLQVGEAYHNWFWISEVDKLRNEPRLTYESWEKIQSGEFAKMIAEWVNQIADTYEAVLDEMG